MSPQEARSYLKELNAKEKRLKKIDKKWSKANTAYKKARFKFFKLENKKHDLYMDICRLKRDIEI